MNIEDAITAFLEHRKARRRSPGTLKQYNYHLNDLWQTWRHDHGHADDMTTIAVEQLARYFTYLAHEHINKRTGNPGMSPETINCAWRAIRAFWNFSAKRKWLTEDQKDYFKDDEYIPRPAVDERMRPVLDDQVLHAILDACNTLQDPEERTRNRAIVQMFAESGMRVSELAGMLDSKVLEKERCAAIIGKGNREEWVFWHNGTARALKAYLRVRAKPTGTVFRRLGGVEAMNADDIRKVVKDMARIAGVEVPAGAPIHSFRHRFAHKALDAGLDVTQVGQLMRHRSQQTTYRYLQENKDRLRKIRDKMGED